MKKYYSYIIGTILIAIATLLFSPVLFAQTTETWTRVSTENGTFNISGTRTVRFGSDTRWVQRSMTGPGQWCTVPFFGRDPATGVPKVCEVLTVSVQEGTWSRVARENGHFNITGTRLVRFGAGGLWVQRNMTGPGQWCTVGMFGRDPAPGVPNVCEVFTPASAMPSLMGHGALPYPTVPQYWSATDRVLFTGEIGDRPGDGTDTGSFRTVCEPTHMNHDDPIVFPGIRNEAHGHTYAGNNSTDYSLTPDNIRSRGVSSCRGGNINMSAYWWPSMVDMRTNRFLFPRTVNIYYKTGIAHFETIHPMPPRLRMIAGFQRQIGPIDWWLNHAVFECFNVGEKHDTIPNCAPGDEMVAQITFPQCWDGVNLDSPDHKSHMAYADTATGYCPASHPVALPELAYRVHYEVTEYNQPTHWRFSSDTYQGPAGYSFHADWINGWDQEAMETFVRECLNTRRDCHSHLLGDGRAIY